MPSLASIPTPALVLDRGRLTRNIARMRAALAPHHVAFRPHAKTAKSADVMRLATAGEAGGITASTVAEVEHFAANGFQDILLAVSITADKLARLASVVARGTTVTVLTDRADVARSIAASRVPVRVLIEVDCGEGRSGVLSDDPALVAIAQVLGSRCAGVLTHGGHSYRVRGMDAFAEVAEQERRAVVAAAETLRAAGHRVDVVSVGSTPTALAARSWDGVTEVRAGVYVFGDLFQAAIGSCTHEDIAVTVLATVIGQRPEQGLLLLDAGALALSKDRSTATTDADAGFGLVWDLEGAPRFGDARVGVVYQEHGLAVCGDGWPWDALPVGSRVRIAPNHACITSAAHDRYHVVDGGIDVVAEWERGRGW